MFDFDERSIMSNCNYHRWVEKRNNCYSCNNGQARCSSCGGIGKFMYHSFAGAPGTICNACNGSGSQKCNNCYGNGYTKNGKYCSECGETSLW